MSSYQVLLSISRKLRELLFVALSDDAQIGINEADIVFDNPTEADKTAKLSLWLYRVSENSFVKNSPMVNRGVNQRSGASTRQYPPLALDLYYLVTPIKQEGRAVDTSLLILGKTMQALYDRAITIHTEEGFEDSEELRISLMPLTLEEQTRIWEALQEPYQLSVCYQVRVAHIQSDRQLLTGVIDERSANFEG